MDTYWFLVHIGSFTSMALLDISATQSNINLNSSHTIIGYNYKYFHVVLFSVDRNSNGKRSWAFDTYAYAGDMKTCLQNTFSKSIFKIMFCWYLDLADCSSNHFPDCVLETCGPFPPEFHSPLIIAVKRPLMNVRQNCKYRKGNQRKPVLLI